MNIKHLSYIFLTFVLLGFVASAYLSLTIVLGVAPVCGPLGGCAEVLSSEWSKMLGIPLAYIGVAFYLVGSVVGSLIAEKPFGPKLALLYSVVGAGMSAWFLYIQGAIIGHFCVYCMVSAFATFALLATSIVIWKKVKTSDGTASSGTQS